MRIATGHLILSWLCLFLATQAYAQKDAAPGATIGKIERLDPALDELIAPGAKIELLASGFDWSEGPVWIKDGGFVIFSDVPQNVVYRWKEGEGISTYLKPAGFTGDQTDSPEPGSNGLAVDAQGRLLLCQHGDRRLARMDAATDSPAPEFTSLVDRYEGHRFNSPNDLAVHSSGAIYFTDPPYGLVGKFNDSRKEIDFQGVYRLSPSGEVSLLTRELKAPNGVALSPDEATLYVAQSDSEKAIIMAYDVTPDGGIKNARVLFDATPLVKTRQGAPDGLKVDAQGNLFATGPGGVLVLTPDGKHLGTIMTGERIANCAFGDDGRTLYMTSDMHLCRVRLKTIGDGFGRAE